MVAARSKLTADPTAWTAAEIARRVRWGDVSAREVIEAHIGRIESVNDPLNAVVIERYQEARREADAIDRRSRSGGALPPLAGVPITVKECFALSGTPTTCGIQGRDGDLPEADDPWVAALRAQGAVVLGKTNVSQALMFFETDNPVYGRTNNPWNLSRSPGGSSGGESAIIAAGGAALGLATDMAGSVRVPAAFCGLVGLKPTEGRFPDRGRFSVPFGERTISNQVGVIARSAVDVELGMRALTTAKLPVGAAPVPWIDPSTVDLRGRGVGLLLDDGFLSPSISSVRAAELAAMHLERAGMRVKKFEHPEIARLMEIFLGLLSGDLGAGIRRTLGNSARDRRIERMMTAATATGLKRALVLASLSLTRREKLRRIVAQYGRGDVDRHWQLAEELYDLRDRFHAALDAAELDAIVLPAFAVPAVVHGATEELIVAGAYTCMWNALGWPAGVVPVTRVREDEARSVRSGDDKMDAAARACEEGSAGLPVGAQIAARPWCEHLILAAQRAVLSRARLDPSFPWTPIAG